MTFQPIQRVVFAVLLSFISGMAANAQNYSIIEDLEQDKPGQGKIQIRSDAAVSALIGKNDFGSNASEDSPYVLAPGYRINVFSGNTRQSKEEAFSKERQIKELFPDLATYVKYDSPLWRLRAGNFESSEEAMLYMQTLKNELPSLGKEMYVVTDEIRIPVHE